MARRAYRVTSTAPSFLQKPGRYPYGDSLFCHVRRSGHKTWLLAIPNNGRTRILKLGLVADLSLGMARRLAAVCRSVSTAGGHPFRLRPRSQVARLSPPLQSVYAQPEPETAPLYIRWPEGSDVRDNWGDKLNPALVHLISGRDAINANHRPSRDDLAYLVIGSNLKASGKGVVVWGSGFMIADAVCKATPQTVCAVRGPLSRSRLLELGYDCPDVVGDPAIFYPLFYRPVVTPRYDIGLIRHFREHDLPPPRLPQQASLKEIDITGSLEGVIDDILSCRAILSSSLHGLIAAHAYGVPAGWIRLSDRPLGDGFKFRDYWASIGIDHAVPSVLEAGADAAALMTLPRLPKKAIDARALLLACPFIDPDHRDGLLADCVHIGRRPL